MKNERAQRPRAKCCSTTTMSQSHSGKYDTFLEECFHEFHHDFFHFVPQKRSRLSGAFMNHVSTFKVNLLLELFWQKGTPFQSKKHQSLDKDLQSYRHPASLKTRCTLLGEFRNFFRNLRTYLEIFRTNFGAFFNNHFDYKESGYLWYKCRPENGSILGLNTQKNEWP